MKKITSLFLAAQKNNYVYYTTALIFILSLTISCSTPTNQKCGIPSFKNSHDTLDFIKNAKTYLVKTADRGLFKNPYCEEYPKVRFKDLNACMFINIFEEDKGVTSCDLSASLLAKILYDNGINAYTYNFGFTNTSYTHVICLVNYRDKLIITDPYMNVLYMNEANEPIDFFDLIKLIKRKEYSKIILQTDTMACDFIINSSELRSFPFEKIPESCRYLYPDLLRESKEVNVIKKKQSVYFGHKSMECNDFIGGIEKRLKENNYDGDFKEALLLKIGNVYGAEGHEILNAKIDSALSN